jgi:Tfp pilus assembly protein PilW
MLKLVLWGNKSPWQIWGASIGVFIGMLLLLFAMQVFFDVQILARGARDSNILILNKRVRTTSEKSFSEAEVDEIRKKPFFKLVEPFESNRYEVWADMKQLGFSTILFFQSIPNSFIDVDTTEFKWEEGDELIPVVMSNDYLTLYNFGFGAGQGLPKISADLVSSFTFDLNSKCISVVLPKTSIRFLFHSVSCSMQTESLDFRKRKIQIRLQHQPIIPTTLILKNFW